METHLEISHYVRNGKFIVCIAVCSISVSFEPYSLVWIRLIFFGIIFYVIMTRYSQNILIMGLLFVAEKWVLILYSYKVCVFSFHLVNVHSNFYLSFKVRIFS